MRGAAEGVGLDDVGAGFEVLAMNILDDVGARDVEDFGTVLPPQVVGLDGQRGLMNHGAHGPVEDQYTVFQAIYERLLTLLGFGHRECASNSLPCSTRAPQKAGRLSEVSVPRSPGADCATYSPPRCKSAENAGAVRDRKLGKQARRGPRPFSNLPRVRSPGTKASAKNQEQSGGSEPKRAGLRNDLNRAEQSVVLIVDAGSKVERS